MSGDLVMPEEQVEGSEDLTASSYQTQVFLHLFCDHFLSPSLSLSLWFLYFFVLFLFS